MRLRVRVAGVVAEALGAVSVCERLPAFHLSVRAWVWRSRVVAVLWERWAEKHLWKQLETSGLVFGDLKIFCTWWLSPHCFFFFLSRLARSVWYFTRVSGATSWALELALHLANMGVSVHRAEVPIKKFKNISNCPDQGSLSLAFTNASVFGSQSAASVAICACAWEKKGKIKRRQK